MPSSLDFSTDRSRMDVARIHRWLSEESYWARGRTLEAHEAAMAASRVYGVFDAASGEQVAFARAITDTVTFAWVADVFVDTAHRGGGVGKRLIAGILDDLEPLGLKRVALFTADAQQLYRQYGFEVVAQPESWMVRMGANARPDEPVAAPGALDSPSQAGPD